MAASITINPMRIRAAPDFLPAEYRQIFLGFVVIELPGNKADFLMHTVLPQLKSASTCEGEGWDCPLLAATHRCHASPSRCTRGRQHRQRLVH